MSLEFTKIISDIEKMGRYLAFRDREELIDRALRILEEKGSNLDFIQQRIRIVRESDISGYRGGAPMDGATEAFDQVAAPKAVPREAILIAADGSQIYPSFESSGLYYVINIGVLIYYHGTGEMPAQETIPGIFYNDGHILDETRQVISNRTVNSRRTIAEIRTLWMQARLHRTKPLPTIALHDGNLLKFFGGSDITDSRSLINEYMGLLVALQDANTVLVGYVDNPRSGYLISLLHLLDLEPYEISDATLQTNGELEGLTDLDVMERILGPGERSMVMVQNSPTNYEYKKFNPSHEIAALYVNVSDNGTPHIARVDVPMWVARDTAMIDTVHTLLLEQCRMQGLRPYPYALTRADELAYISGREKEQVESLIRRELMRNNVVQRAGSAKASSKDFARDSGKQGHRLGGYPLNNR
ncbi:MAG: DNA double-strand break repair nuclease NurA [Chloroflexota bacterium]